MFINGPFCLYYSCNPPSMDCSPKLSRPLIFGPYGHLPVGWAASIGTTTGGGETQQLFETRARTPTASDSDDDTHHSQKLVDFPPRRVHQLKRKCCPPKRGRQQPSLWIHCQNFVNISLSTFLMPKLICLLTSQFVKINR